MILMYCGRIIGEIIRMILFVVVVVRVVGGRCCVWLFIRLWWEEFFLDWLEVGFFLVNLLIEVVFFIFWFFGFLDLLKIILKMKNF